MASWRNISIVFNILIQIWLYLQVFWDGFYYWDYKSLVIYINCYNTQYKTFLRIISFRKYKFCAERESIEYDVLVVGAGPAGLASAIKMK